MICFRYEGGNQRSLTMLREKDQDIQIRVSDEEKEESCQQPAGVIRPSQQQQTPQNRLGRLALKKRRARYFQKLDWRWNWNLNKFMCSLSNHKLQEHHNKDAISKIFQFIQNKLLEHEITVIVKQILDKLTSLRTYYEAEKYKVESSKRSGTGRGDLRFSKWRFFDFIFSRLTHTPTQGIQFKYWNCRHWREPWHHCCIFGSSAI